MRLLLKFGMAFAAMVTLLFMTVAPMCADPGGGGNNAPPLVTASIGLDGPTIAFVAHNWANYDVANPVVQSQTHMALGPNELATANLNNSTDLNQNTGADTAINGKNTDVAISTEGAIKEGLGDVILPNIANLTAIANNTDNQARIYQTGPIRGPTCHGDLAAGE